MVSRKTARLAGIVRESVVDGPGFRFVVFAQGCHFACDGCHNPHSQAIDGGFEVTVNDIIEQINRAKLITGITFSGGEPFLQADALCEVGRFAHERGLNIMTFTGYTWEELMELAKTNTAVCELITLSKLIVDGRFDKNQRDPNLAFRGSRNQRIVDVAKTLESGQIELWEEPV